MKNATPQNASRFCVPILNHRRYQVICRKSLTDYSNSARFSFFMVWWWVAVAGLQPERYATQSARYNTSGTMSDSCRSVQPVQLIQQLSGGHVSPAVPRTIFFDFHALYNP
jgi:hypothetical protein